MIADNFQRLYWHVGEHTLIETASELQTEKGTKLFNFEPPSFIELNLKTHLSDKCFCCETQLGAELIFTPQLLSAIVDLS